MMKKKKEKRIIKMKKIIIKKQIKTRMKNELKFGLRKHN
jgi:hypothetical protein